MKSITPRGRGDPEELDPRIEPNRSKKRSGRWEVSIPPTGQSVDVHPATLESLFTPTRSLPALDPGGPGRPVDYRWQLALRWARGEPVPATWKDHAVRDAHRFLRAANGRLDDDRLLALRPRHPHAVDALTIRRHSRPALLWELEARVLARQTPGEIAAVFAMSPAAVALYEAWFFGVRDRLDAASYIQHFAVRGHSPDADPIERLLKHYGYSAGPLVLDAIVRGTNSPNQPRPAGEVNAFFRAQTGEQLAVRAAIATHQLPADETTALMLVKLLVRMRRMEKKQTVGGRAGLLAPNIRAMLEGLPWQPPDRGRPKA